MLLFWFVIAYVPSHQEVVRVIVTAVVLLKILLLVLSNAAMLPAVLLCVRKHYAFVAALLGMSAASSAVYHLCDTDVYCIAGLSFYSLQVLRPLDCILLNWISFACYIG